MNNGLSPEQFKKEVRTIADEVGVKVKEIHIRSMKRKWASCSSKGRLTFNPALLEEQRDKRIEAILHELLHLRYHNHGRMFHRLLKHYTEKLLSISAQEKHLEGLKNKLSEGIIKKTANQKKMIEYSEVLSVALTDNDKELEDLKALKEDIAYVEEQGIDIEEGMYENLDSKMNLVLAQSNYTEDKLAYVSTDMASIISSSASSTAMTSLMIMDIESNIETNYQEKLSGLPSKKLNLLEKKDIGNQVKKYLKEFNESYYERYLAALRSASYNESEKLRQAVSSLRELFSNIIWKLAPNERLKSEGYVNVGEKPKRTDRFKYILQKGLNVNLNKLKEKTILNINIDQLESEYKKLYGEMSSIIHPDKTISKHSVNIVLQKYNFIINNLLKIWKYNKKAFQDT